MPHWRPAAISNRSPIIRVPDILVVIEPLAHLVSRERLHTELAHTSGTMVRFGPDAAMIDVFRTYAANPLASWPEAFRQGVRQADSLARRLADAGWPTPKR